MEDNILLPCIHTIVAVPAMELSLPTFETIMDKNL